MKQFYLAEITTKDKLVLHGLFYKPEMKPHNVKGVRSKAILWIHGLTSTFYNGKKMLEELAELGEKEGYAVASFNNRGHDCITGVRKLDPTSPKGYTHENAGAGYEKFTESVHDIAAAVDFLVSEGFNEVILVGHSTGANKACYYAATQKNPRVTAVVLAGPASDRLDPTLDAKKLASDIIHMEQLIKKGKGDELLLGYHYFPMTAKRFISMFKPNTDEDTFDYGDTKKLYYFSKIKLPILVLWGGADEYLDRPVRDVVKVFDGRATSDRYSTIIVRDALHSFNGKEKETAGALVGWMKSL